MIGVPRDWCVAQSGADGVEFRRGVWRTTLGDAEVREWINSVERIERREEQSNRWVEWSKDNLSPEGARSVSRFIGSGAALRFWRKRRERGGCLLVDGELYQGDGIKGVMVFHADRPDWWISLRSS